MRISCPNLSDEQYLKLEKLYGATNAVALYMQYGAEIPAQLYELGGVLPSNMEDIKSAFRTNVNFNEVIDIPKSLFLAALDGDVVEPAVSEETQEVTVKGGVNELFESNPDLAAIGTAEEYSQYLDTIFPDSQVKDIVYHNSPNKFDKFDNLKVGTTTSGVGSEDRFLGIFFTSDKNAYEGFNIKGFQYPSLLNLKNPINGGINYNNLPNLKTEEDFKNYQKQLIKDKYDGIQYGKAFMDMEDGKFTIPILEAVVFKPEQIHILGTNQDIEGFKKWKEQEVSQPSKKEIKKETLNKLQKSLGNSTEKSGSVYETIKQLRDFLDTYSRGEDFNIDLPIAINLDGIFNRPELDDDQFDDHLNDIYDVLNRLESNWLDYRGEVTGKIYKGFRSYTVQSLREFGWSIEDASNLETVLAEEDLNEDEPQGDEIPVSQKDDVALAEKNYSISNFEIDPATTVSQEVKRLLQGIKATTPGRYGFIPHIPVSRIYGKAMKLVSNLNTYEEMISVLEAKAKKDNEIAILVNFIKNATSAQKAQFFKVLRNDKTDFFVYEQGGKIVEIEEEYSEETQQIEKLKDTKKEYQKSSSIISLTSINSDTILVNRWKKNMMGESASVVNPHLYSIKTDSQGDEVISIRPTTTDGKDRLSSIRNNYNVIISAKLRNNLEENIVAIGNLLWDFGINMGSTRETTIDAVREYADGNINTLNRLINPLKKVLEGVVEVERKGANIVGIKSLKSKITTPVYSTAAKSIGDIARELSKVFTEETATSQINGKGNASFPHGKPTFMTMTLNDINSGTSSKQSNTYLELSQDISLNPSEDHRLLLLKLIEDGVYKLKTDQFSASRYEGDDVNEAKDYRELGDRNLLILFLDNYLNTGGEDMRIPIPTQESRENLPFMTLPRFSSSATGKSDPRINKSEREIIQSIIIRDLVRINRDSKISNGISDYHGTNRVNSMTLSGTSDLKLEDGNNLSNDILNMLEYGRIQYSKEWAALDSLVDNYLNVTLQAKIEEFKGILKSLNITKSNLNAENYDKLFKDNFDEFIRRYVFDTIVSNIELTNLFRGSQTYFGSINKLYKRWGFLNTPGSNLFLQGSDPNNPEYGMLRKFNQVAFNDLSAGTDENQFKVHEAIADAYEKVLLDQGLSPERAKALASSFRPGKAKGTDALALISPEMFRHVMQGGGGSFVWNEDHEKMYNNYKETGEWKFDFTPGFKYGYDSTGIKNIGGQNIYASELDKNSWFVLTPEVAKGNPILEDMLSAMNGKYTNGVPIHIFNAVSAKKGISTNVFNIDTTKTGEFFEGVQYNEQDANRLVEPQILSGNTKESIRFNSQIRRHAVFNLEMDGLYNMSGETISGEDLFGIYQKSIYARLNTSLKEVAAEVGYSEYLTAMQNNDRKGMGVAKAKMLKKIAELAIDSANRNGKLNNDLEEQLRIRQVIDDFITDFEVPVGFPTNERDLMSQFISIFRAKAAKVLVPGIEAVQVGTLGKMNINGELRELKFFDISNNEWYAEVALSEDILEALGIEIGDSLDLSDPKIQDKLMMLGYRIPHQSLASSIVLKAVAALPKSYKKHIVVPANFVQATGSDFDWDKLYIIRHDIDKSGEIALPSVPLMQLAQQSPEYFTTLDPKILNNLILRAQMAVSQSPQHLEEMLSGVEAEEYAATAARIEDLRGKSATDEVSLDDPSINIKMYRKFMRAAGLVGQYANMDAGLGVAVHGNLGDNVRGLALNPNATVTWIEGDMVFELNQIKNRSDVTGLRINSFFTSHLSAALDVGGQENPLQDRTNDSSETAKVSLHLASVGVPQSGVIAFRMQQLVEDMLNLINNGDGTKSYTPYAAFTKVLIDNGVGKKSASKFMGSALSGKVQMTPMSMGSIELSMLEDKNSPLNIELFKNFIISYYRGKDLYQALKKITPDTLDGLNDLGQMQATVESAENELSADPNKVIVAYEDLNQFLEGDRFLVSKAFHEYFKVVFNAAGVVFPSASESFVKFKEILKNTLGLENLTGAQHRKINRLLLYCILTKPGSRANNLFLSFSQKTSISSKSPSVLVKKQQDNIFTMLNTMINKYPLMRNDDLLSSLELDVADKDKRLIRMILNSKGRITSDRFNDYRRTMERLVYAPETFIGPNATEEQRKEVANFGHSLIQYALISSAFLPGDKTLYKYIPGKYFQDLGIFDEYRAELSQVMSNPEYFENSEFVMEFIRNFGLSAGLVQNRKVYSKYDYISKQQVKITIAGKKHTVFSIKDPDAPLFVKSYRSIDKKQEGLADRTMLYMKVGRTETESQYIAVVSKSSRNKFYEMNINYPSTFTGGSAISGRGQENNFAVSNITYELGAQVESMIKSSSIPQFYNNIPETVKNYGQDCRG